MREYLADPTDASERGRPLYYADFDKELSTATNNGSTIIVSPVPDQNYNVEYLVNGMKTYLKDSNWIKKSRDNNASLESAVLKLNCDKALELLNWKSILSMDETIQMTSEWYRTYYEKGVKAAKKQSVDQINSYELFLNKRR